LLADISHVGITAYVMGYDQVVDVTNWNAMAIGNIGVTVCIYCLIFLTKTRLIILDSSLFDTLRILAWIFRS